MQMSLHHVSIHASRLREAMRLFVVRSGKNRHVSIHASRLREAMLIFRNYRKHQNKKPTLREPPYSCAENILREQCSRWKTPSNQAKARRANPPGKACPLGVRASSQDERRIEVGRAKTAVFADFVAFDFGDTVEAQVVFPALDFGDQITFQRFEAGAVDLAFEDRFLHPLADAFAEFGNAPQAAAAFAGFGVNVVADDDEQD